MEYAIVDIETTGGHASANGITEIAIVIHDGEKVVDRMETLVNPYQLIPRYVESLTGITNEMVQDAPGFQEIAEQVYEMLNGRVFIAHNVSFDYSFIRYHLLAHGIIWQAPKLCTIRLSRKIFPGHESYSLGNICRSLDIRVENRHRAMGDAEATTLLFQKMLAAGGQDVIKSYLSRGSGEQSAPLYVDVEELQNLPRIPGVYYFFDEKGDVVYVGKALDLKQRVNSHFSNNKPTRQKQEFMRHVHRVKYVPVPNELMAFLLEEAEIKRLWPRYNRSQKKVSMKLGLFCFEDGRGYKHLAVEKMVRGRTALYSFELMSEGRTMLFRLAKAFALCPKLCHVASSDMVCEEEKCACRKTPEAYNAAVAAAIDSLNETLPSFAVMEAVPKGYPYVRKWNPPVVKKKSEGLFEETAPSFFSMKPSKKVFDAPNMRSCILMEGGAFYGMGYIPHHVSLKPETLKKYLVPYPDNDYLRGLVNRYAQMFPDKVVAFKKK